MGSEIDRNVLTDLPKGNEWRFSSYRPFLKEASPSLHEFRNLGQINENALELIAEVSGRYIEKDWKFESIIEADTGSLALIFVHPYSDALTRVCPSPDFLKTEVTDLSSRLTGENVWAVNTDPINQVLNKAGLHAYNAYGSFGEFDLPGRKGSILRKPTTIKHYQPGVAMIHANYHTLETGISLLEYNIKKLSEQADPIEAKIYDNLIQKVRMESLLANVNSQRLQLL